MSLDILCKSNGKKKKKKSQLKPSLEIVEKIHNRIINDSTPFSFLKTALRLVCINPKLEGILKELMPGPKGIMSYNVWLCLGEQTLKRPRRDGV